jgi:hypothetical protein
MSSGMSSPASRKSPASRTMCVRAKSAMSLRSTDTTAPSTPPSSMACTLLQNCRTSTK